jgi:hypothetical protein
MEHLGAAVTPETQKLWAHGTMARSHRHSRHIRMSYMGQKDQVSDRENTTEGMLR